MATRGKFSGSLSRGCDEFFEHACAPCSRKGKTVEAFHECLDCSECFCANCNDVHSTLGATSGHKVLGKDQMGKVAGSGQQKQLPTQKCDVHRGQRIEVYCADHDVICCNTCVSISHTNCDGKIYIVDAAKGVKSGQKLKTTRANLAAALKEVKKGRDTRQRYIDTVDKDKVARVKQAKEYSEKLFKRIRDLERSTVDEITVKLESLSAEAVADVATLNDMISVMEEDLRKLDQYQKKTESQVFVDVKLGQGHAKEGRKLLQQVTSPRQADLNFTLNTEVENFLNGVRSLGIFADNNKVYKAKLSGSYSVKIREDMATCDIQGSCLLPDGTMVVTDYNNNRLKRLATSYRVTDHCNLPEGPWGVTCTAPGEIAVTVTMLKKVQFVSTGASMSLTTSFSTSEYCRGVCYSKGELFVSCGDVTKEGTGHVAVYDLNGTQLRTVKTDPSGQNIFSVPKHISIISDGSRVYVADEKAGIVTLDRKGKRVGSISDPLLEYAFDVCILDNGHVLVSGRHSNNVLQFDGDGRKVGELLGKKDGVEDPRSLCYDAIRSRLVVTMGYNDIIKVFDLV